MRVLLAVSALWVMAAPCPAGGAIPKISLLQEDLAGAVVPELLRYTAEDTSLSAAGYRLTVAGSLRWARLDPPREVVFIRFWSKSYGRGLGEVFLAYDLRAQTVRWARLLGDVGISIVGDVCLAVSGDSAIALSAETGEELWRAPGTPIPAPEGQPIFLARRAAVHERVTGMPAEPDSAPRISELYPGGSRRRTGETPDGRIISAHDPRSGTVRWQRFGRFGGGIEWVTCGDGQCFYTVPLGVEALRFDDGSGWFVPGKSTSSSFMGSLGRALLGGGVIELLSPERTHHLGSRPLEIAGRIHFAAGSEIVSCSAATGEVAWRRKLGALQGVVSLHPTGSGILVVNHGWKYTGNRLEPSRWVSLNVLEHGTGETLHNVQLASYEERTILRHARWEKEFVPRTVLEALPYLGGILLLQPHAIRFLSHQLEPLEDIQSREEYGVFVGTIPTPDGFVVRTTKGVLSLSSFPFRVSWWRALAPPMIHDGKRSRPIDEIAEKRNTIVDTEHAWISPALSWPEMARIAIARATHAEDFMIGSVVCTRSGSGFACLDTGSGRVLLEKSDLQETDIKLDASGWFVSRAENSVAVIRLQGRAVTSSP